MEWESYFRSHILARGFEYFEEGAVEDLEVRKDRITATVWGTERYDVEIKLRDDEVADMSCSCPYAESGENCKHMAAVLYQWEEDDQDQDEEDDWDQEDEDVDSASDKKGTGKREQKEEDKVKELVEQADEKAVRNFLTKILKNDEKMLSRFKLLISAGISREDMDRYKNLVDKTVRRYSGRGGFIPYSEANGFIREMERYLTEDAAGMIERGCLKEAFELSWYVFAEVAQTDMDDSDGGQGEIGENCLEIWEEILDRADGDVERDMYRWFVSRLDGSMPDYMEDYIEDFVMEHFHEKNYLKAKLDFTEKKAQEAKKRSESWSADYETEKWVMRHIGLMEELGQSDDSIDEYCMENWKYTDVRKYCISRCMEQKDYDQAISILKESLKLDASKAGLVRQFSEMLKNIYRTAGKTREYREQLWEIVTKQAPGNLEAFRELKGLYQKEEWEAAREKIFAVLPRFTRIEPLYKEEKLYDRLLNCAVSAIGLYTIQEYEDVLKDRYPREVLQKYTDELMKLAGRTAPRKEYQNWVAILRRMKKIKGGKEQADQIVSQWKSMYSNRPALMDELKKL